MFTLYSFRSEPNQSAFVDLLIGEVEKLIKPSSPSAKSKKGRQSKDTNNNNNTSPFASFDLGTTPTNPSPTATANAELERWVKEHAATFKKKYFGSTKVSKSIQFRKEFYEGV